MKNEILVVLALVLMVSWLGRDVQGESPPNVIFILADDLGYGDLSCNGQTKFETPNIDRLALEGLHFTAHYSGNTVCSPSRANLMTGQHPGHVYIRGNLKGEKGAQLDPQMTVLPEMFQAAGYATGAFGKWGLGQTNVSGASSPAVHGFDLFVGWKSQGIAHTYYPSTLVTNGREIPMPLGTYVHDVIMEKARSFIQDSALAKKPFFCFIPTAVPHAAMHAPRALHEKWRKVYPQFDNRIGTYKADEEACPDVINPIAGFAAMMENLDNEVGTILALVKDLGIDDNTIILFASDNGAHREGGHDPDFWNSTGSLRGMKRDMHEGGIRTPLLVRWPGVVAAGTSTDHPSAFWDIMPTMAELVDQPLPSQADGISFLPTLQGQSDKQQKHEYLYWEFCKGPKQVLFSQAVRKGKWKAYRQVGKKMEIYNLDEDPYEKNDLAMQMPMIVADMKGIIKKAHVPLPSKK